MDFEGLKDSYEVASVIEYLVYIKMQKHKGTQRDFTVDF